MAAERGQPAALTGTEDLAEYLYYHVFDKRETMLQLQRASVSVCVKLSVKKVIRSNITSTHTGRGSLQLFADHSIQ